MKAQYTNKSIENYTFDKNGNINLEINDVSFYTKYQPAFDNNPDCTTYSSVLYTIDADFGEQPAGKIEWDIRWIDGEDGETVLATEVLDDESDVCDWDKFTIYIDPYII